MQDSWPNNYRVLFVGYPSTTATALIALLAENGCVVQTAVNDESAMMDIQHTLPDLIVLDVERTNTDAFAFCRRLKADRTTRDLPILCVLPQCDAVSRDRVFAAGAADYVTAPLQKSEVLARVGTHLALKAAQKRSVNQSARAEAGHHDPSQSRAAPAAGGAAENADTGASSQAWQKLAHDLGERVKELDCLYAISMLVEVPGITLPEILEGVASLLPNAYRYPEIACARITLDGQEYCSAHYGDGVRQQARELWVGDRQAGRIEVCYLEERADENGILFLEEEENFVTAVAQRLGRVVERMQAQEALTQSRERYARAQRAARIGSWDWDILSGDLYWSEQIEPMFGFGRGEFDGTYESFLASVHPADRERVVAAIEACVQEHADYAIEHRIVWPDGTVRWVSERGDVVRDADGRAVQMYGLVHDITERKRVGEQIRQQNVFLNTVIESLTHPFYVVRLEDYTIEIANSVARQGGRPEPCTCYELTHNQERPCWEMGHNCPIQEIVRTRRPAVVEHVHEVPGRGLRHMEVRGYPLFDDLGNVSRAIVYALDVSQRKQAEQALRESEARWRSVTENSPDYVIVLNDQLEIQFVNYASPGLTVEELIGTPLWMLVAEDSQLRVRQTLQSVLETGQPSSYETQYQAPDGTTIYYESRAVARKLDGQNIGLAVNARDITERKRIEQAWREESEAAEQARREERERRQEAERRRQIAESLAEVLVALNSGQPLEQILTRIATQANELLDTYAVALYQVSGQAEELRLQAAAGTVSGVLLSDGRPLGVQALLDAVDARQVVCVSDLAAVPIPQVDAQSVPSIGAQLAVPIVTQDQVYGGILLYYADRHTFFGEELDLAAVFAQQAALAVENTQLRERVQEAAVAEERSRLARDLHDSVTQALFSASLVAEVLPQVWRRDPEEAWHGIEELRALSRSALAEMRTLLLELRPTALVETRLRDLLAQLVEATTGRAQLAVALDIEPCPALPPLVHIAFYRVAQEALNNVVKHSGAKQVTVSLQVTPPVSLLGSEEWQGQVTLCVRDDGQGFDQEIVAPDHLGLGFMRERAAAMGGRLNIQSERGQGTQVMLCWGNLPP